MKRLTILGSTGSIGTQALDVAHWRGYDIVGLAAGKNVALLLEQIRTFRPAFATCDPSVEAKLVPQMPAGTQLLSGPGRLEELAAQDTDTVLAAIPGIAGLAPTAAALRAGRHVALANKEAMVVAGPLMWELAKAHGARITPVDSEHAALFQCLLGERTEDVDTLILTASGGPFRTSPRDLSQVTPADALKHPTWSMGHKVTIDSATLFNKGLEVLEAHFLFHMPLDKIEVVIHPQSLVHGLVRFKDGSYKAQVGPHDMRLPIQYAISAPERPEIPLTPLPIEGCWEFFAPDLARFPSLALAFEAGQRGGVAPVAINAADELAVSAFLQGKILFTGIPEVLEYVLERVPSAPLGWDAIRETDQEARRLARRRIAGEP